MGKPPPINQTLRDRIKIGTPITWLIYHDLAESRWKQAVAANVKLRVSAETAGPALRESATIDLDKFISDLATAKVNLFKGPLNYQDGKPFVAAGQTASDKQIWSMEQLLEGMDSQPIQK